MRRFASRTLVSTLALAMLLGPVLAATAEAGSKYRRGERRTERRVERRGERHVERRVERHHDRGRHRGHDRRVTVIHRDVHRHRHGGGGIVPFLGGVAIGAIITSHRSCPPPPPPVRRVYVYDCGFCDGLYRDYDAYLDHVVVVHHVDRCNIERYYPMYDGGYWEEY